MTYSSSGGLERARRRIPRHYGTRFNENNTVQRFSLCKHWWQEVAVSLLLELAQERN